MTYNEPSPAGWYYADGDPPGTQRYWDGELWRGEPVPVGMPGPPGSPGMAMPGAPQRGTEAGWGTRAAALIIDYLIFAVMFLVVVAVASVLSVASETLGLIAGVLLGLPVLMAMIYVLLYLPGKTGQSPGRRYMGYEIVSIEDGSYIGGWPFVGRQFLGSIINQLCYLDYLWPLWDDRNQRLSDKALNSIAVRKPEGKGKLLPIFPSGKPF